MHDDAWRALCLARLVEGRGHLVEADHPPDAGERVEPTLAYRVERPVPVVGQGTTTELERHALPGAVGAVDGVVGVPRPRDVDPRPHLAGLHELLHEPGCTDALEHHRWCRHP